MLSYRHGFHAGNHADVLKHFIMLQLLDYLTAKDKPLWYIDTHAGAGRYSLREGYATKTTEFQGGIGRLWQAQDLPQPLADYVTLVREFNPDGQLGYYPGSPLLADGRLRNDDRLHLFELHPSDYTLLQANFPAAGKRVKLYHEDGVKGIKALLPPLPRRGLILIDPPYELDSEYLQVVRMLEDCLVRFATGVYAVWYPLLQERAARLLPQQLQDVAPRWLSVTLQVMAPLRSGHGMHGSGVLIINPPWTLLPTLNQTMGYLTNLLGHDEGAGFVIDSRGLS